MEPRARVVESEEAPLQYAVPEGDFAVVSNRAFVEQTNTRSQLKQEASQKSSRADAVRTGVAESQRRVAEVREQLESRVVTWTTDGEGRAVSIIAWMPPGRGLYVGLVLETVGLIDRLQTTLPLDRNYDERYALVASGEGYHYDKSHRGPPLQPFVQFPLSSALLPGWRVEGFWEDTESAMAIGSYPVFA